jgi:hypothetical protein
MRNYYIDTIAHYPDDGKHQECWIDLPFQIRKGEDGYYYKKKGKEYKYNMFKDENKIDDRWICWIDSDKDRVNPSLTKIFEIQVGRNLDKIVDYCYDIYLKSLVMELDRVKKLRNELESK